MRGLAILVVLTLVLDGQSCFAFYNVSCLPDSMKGIIFEKWFDGNDSNIDSLEDVKLAILKEVKPDVVKIATPTHLSLNFPREAGRRWRSLFVCSMRGKYEFYFSCKEACEWFLMEAGDNSSIRLVGGNSSVEMPTTQFIKAEMSVNLTEGRAYYFEVIQYSAGKGHLILKMRGPGEETAWNMNISHLFTYREDGYYDTLHPGEWEAWSPCSTSCGPDGRQTRNRSCLTHPVIFNYSADGYALSQSRTCNTEVMPCGGGCTNHTDITDPSRSVDTIGDSQLCDQHVFTGDSWIRFTGSGGTTIPEYAPEPNHCGTKKPGWVQGDHPALADGIVQRELCFRLNKEDCHYRYNVTIQNCGPFYVYMPPFISECKLRICTIVGPITAPSNVRGHHTSSTSIMVVWDDVPAFDGNCIITSYNITYHSLAENHIDSIMVDYSVRQETLKDLKEFVSYSIRVFASTKKGDGPASEPIIIRTDQDKPTAAPLNVTGHNTSSTSILVEWDDVPAFDQNGIITSYNITYSSQTENHNGFAEAGPIDRQKELTGLREFVNYNITVRASTSKGDGPDSSPIVVRTGQDIPDLPPAGITAHGTSPTSIKVSWKPVPEGHENGVILGYRILFVDAAELLEEGHSFDVHFNFSSLEVNGLTRFTNYCVQVFAFTEKGDGKMSDCLYALTAMGVPSLAPSNLSAFSSDGSTVNLSWNAVPEIEGEVEIVGYAVIINGSEENAIKFVAPCSSPLLLKNVSFSDDTCIHMAALSIDGFGILSDCTIIKVPTGSGGVKRNISPMTYTTKSMSSSSIGVKLQNIAEKQANEQLEGFYIRYQAVSKGGEPVPDLLSEPNYTMTVCAGASKVTLTGLMPYTTYKIEVALMTSKGVGEFSEPLHAETCRCSEKLGVSLVPNSLDLLGTVSLTRVIHDLVISTCGTCAAHGHTKLVSSNITQENQVSFPVTRTQTIGDTAYSKFVPVISVPGFVVVKRRDSPIPTFTKLLTTSIFESWPVCVLALLTALLAGIIIWILDSKTNPKHFPRTFFKGAGTGFWWSFITMSTVGYGDRCPQSVPAKVFSIVWFLIGLVIFTLFHGTLTSLLTVTVMRIQMDANGLSSSGDGKVAVVSNSSSYQVAVKKFPNKLAIGSVFSDLNSMIEALRSGNISSVLLDMYVPAKRKDLFNGSWFHVSEFLEGEIAHGILLQGEGVNLAKELKNLIKMNNVEAEFLKQDDKGTEKSEETESTSAVFFEPSSPYFLNTMMISVGLLLLAVTCGLFYQAFCYRLCCKRTSKGTCRCRIMKKDIAESVEAFHRSFSQTYHRLRERQMQQLQQAKESKRTISKETSTSYDSDEVLARMY